MTKIRNLVAKAEIQFWKLLVDLMKNQNLLRWPPTARIILFVAGILIAAGLVFFPIRSAVLSITADHAAIGVSSQNSVNNTSGNDEKLADGSLIGDQTNLLIVLVDSLGKEKPALRGVWLAGHVTSVPQVVFLPLYPSTRETETGYYEGLFGLTAGQKPAEEFLEFLRTKEISWSHYLVLDETSLVELVSLINRDSAESQATFTPASVTGLLNESQTAAAQIKAQARLASSICQSAPELIRNADPTIIWSLLTHRMRSDIELQSVAAAHQTLGQPGENPVCEFPTLRELTYRTDTH